MRRFLHSAGRMKPLAVDDVLAGRYRLVRHLATGGMGEVWRARALGPAGFERPVAIKVLHADDDGAPQSERTEMFLDEARVSAGLDHPNIVQTVELGRHAGRYFIVMELVDGLNVRELARRLAAIRLEVRQVVHIVGGLLDALEHAHQACAPGGAPLRIVHRDVCPRNLLVSRDGHVKLTDFGIARAANNRHITREQVMKGKLDRMAPEQLQLAHVDARTDVYGAGLILFELLARRAPYAGLLHLPAIQLAARKRPLRLAEHLDDVDPRLDAIVQRATAFAMADRFESARDMRAALRPFVGDAIANRRELALLVDAVADGADVSERTPTRTAPTRSDRPRPPC